VFVGICSIVMGVVDPLLVQHSTFCSSLCMVPNNKKIKMFERCTLSAHSDSVITSYTFPLSQPQVIFA